MRYKALLFSSVLQLLTLDAEAAEVQVDQNKLQFMPTEIVVHSGDTLVFTNHDNTNHNIQVVNADGDAMDKGLQRPGEIVKHVFPTAGSYQVRCLIHPDMLLTVTVK